MSAKGLRRHPTSASTASAYFTSPTGTNENAPREQTTACLGVGTCRRCQVGTTRSGSE